MAVGPSGVGFLPRRHLPMLSRLFPASTSSASPALSAASSPASFDTCGGIPHSLPFSCGGNDRLWSLILRWLDPSRFPATSAVISRTRPAPLSCLASPFAPDAPVWALYESPSSRTDPRAWIEPSSCRNVPRGSSITDPARGFASCFRSNSMIASNHDSPAFVTGCRAYSARGWGKVGPGGAAVRRKRSNQDGRSPPIDMKYVAKPVPRRAVKELQLSGRVTVRQLAGLLGEKLPAVEATLAALGEVQPSSDTFLTMDTAELVALEFGRDVKQRQVSSEERAREGSSATWVPRAPVVVVMGHVDHGKTSLLDALRSTSVAEREAGGITQHIGAFVVEMASGAKLTFLDTPGHAAFAAMRARGAALTDIVVLVVAADDGVMPQTLEAIAHARSAGVPIVVAINKMDKEGADPSHVRQQLLQQGLELEEAGGDVQAVEVSAKSGAGLQQLEEALLLQAELMDLRGRGEGAAEATVVEARVDRGAGPLATVIVRGGVLRGGDHVVAGAQWGRVRMLKDVGGRGMGEAGPSQPAEISGLRGLPEAGDSLLVVHSEERARQISTARQEVSKKLRMDRLDAIASAKAATSAEGGTGSAEGDGGGGEAPPSPPLEAVLVVKADVQGTAEAVCSSLESLSTRQVAVRVVHLGVGPISQSDVALAESTGAACIVGFNVKGSGAGVEGAAKQAGVEIRHHAVIYHLLEDLGGLLVGLAPGVKETEVGGQAEVMQVFEVKGRGREGVGAAIIAGCRVASGRLNRRSRFRVLRSGEVLYEGACATLRREKQDVDAVGSGSECGFTFGEWREFRRGDVLQCLEDVMRKPKLVSSQNGTMRIEC